MTDEISIQYYPDHDRIRHWTEHKSLELDCLRTHIEAITAYIFKTCPPGKERTVALNKIEEALLWAGASIAKKSPPLTLEST